MSDDPVHPTPDESLARRESAFYPWQNWEAQKKFAAELIASGFCPTSVTKPSQVIAIMATGRELGIPPMQALRQIHVIQGRPTVSGELMLAKMLKGGVKVRWIETTDTVAVMVAERPGLTSFEARFTIEDAQRAGLTSKDGWRKYPATMLRWRVISMAAKMVAPDLVGGLYTPEELGADVDVDGEVVVPPALAPMPTNTPDSWIESFEKAPTLTAVQLLWTQVKASPEWSAWDVHDQGRVFVAKTDAELRVQEPQE